MIRRREEEIWQEMGKRMRRGRCRDDEVGRRRRRRDAGAVTLARVEIVVSVMLPMSLMETTAWPGW